MVSLVVFIRIIVRGKVVAQRGNTIFWVGERASGEPRLPREIDRGSPLVLLSHLDQHPTLPLLISERKNR